MKYYYDLHIHSCLSPCADDEMTPQNISAMAKIAGLDIIAVTDHNSALNARAVQNASKQMDGPIVIAGMELETEEGIHIILLFSSIEDAENASKEIYKKMLKMPYDTNFYGKQLVMDENDNIIEERKDYLGIPTDINLYDVREFAKKHNAICYPAHINRESNGILSVLGAIDDDMGFNAVELNPSSKIESHEKQFNQQGYTILYASDAHSLQQIGFIDFDKNYLNLNSLDTKSILEYIIKRR